MLELVAEFAVVGVGQNATDTLILLSHFPAYAGKVAFERELLSPGGQVASALVTCAKLGLRVKYVGTVGDDERGRIQLESLRQTGINLDDVDVDTIYHGFDQVLPHVDYLVASSEFPVQWTNERDPFRALEMIQEEFHIPVAAMTLGAHGALARMHGRFIYSPAFVVNCADTTGAGDVFHGAFCYAVLQNMPMRDALDFANAMAALNCMEL